MTVRFFLQACPCFSPWLSGEGLAVLGDELLERRRLASADLVDHVVGAREDAVLEIDHGLAQMLDEEGIPCATLGLLLELAVHGRRTRPQPPVPGVAPTGRPSGGPAPARGARAPVAARPLPRRCPQSQR